MPLKKARAEQQQPLRKIEREGVRRVESILDPAAQIQERIEKRVFGQPKAALAVSRSLIRFEGGMRDRNRPIGVFLFIGPTGVGKTEMALAVADTWFDGDINDKNFLKLDMSEFSESHTISRIVGSPPGYIGNTEPIAIPHSWANTSGRKILLLDEWEKAHQEVQKVFLSVFENAQIKARDGAKGHLPLHFEDTLIICTTNAGSVEMNEAQSHRPLGFKAFGGSAPEEKSEAAIERIAQKALSRYFRPELLRRMNSVVFNNLQEAQYHPILNKFLKQRNDENLTRRAPTILLSREVRAHLINEALKSKELGGSALRQTFEDLIVADVSNRFVAGAIKSNEVVRFELEDEGNGPVLVMYAWTNAQLKEALTIEDLPADMLEQIRALSGDSDDHTARLKKNQAKTSPVGDMQKRQQFPQLPSGLPKKPR